MRVHAAARGGGSWIGGSEGISPLRRTGTGRSGIGIGIGIGVGIGMVAAQKGEDPQLGEDESAAVAQLERR
jgi:hypothetical protein